MRELRVRRRSLTGCARAAQFLLAYEVTSELGSKWVLRPREIALHYLRGWPPRESRTHARPTHAAALASAEPMRDRQMDRSPLAGRFAADFVSVGASAFDMVAVGAPNGQQFADLKASAASWGVGLP